MEFAPTAALGPAAPSVRPRPRFAAQPASLIVVCAIALTILGLTVLFSASASLKQGPYFYLGKQVTGVGHGQVLCFVVSRVNLDYARRYSPGGSRAAMLALLVLVLLPHVGVSVERQPALARARRGRGCRSPSSPSWRWSSAWPTTWRSTRPASASSSTGFSIRSRSSAPSAPSILKEPDFGTAALDDRRSGSPSSSWRARAGATSCRPSRAVFLDLRGGGDAQPQPPAPLHRLPRRRGQQAEGHLPAVPVDGGLRGRRGRRGRVGGGAPAARLHAGGAQRLHLLRDRRGARPALHRRGRGGVRGHLRRRPRPPAAGPQPLPFSPGGGLPAAHLPAGDHQYRRRHGDFPDQGDVPALHQRRPFQPAPDGPARLAFF